jgi:hypothetical protein
MRQQTMPAKADTEAADDPISDQQRCQILPAKCKECGNCQEMERRNYCDVFPVDRSADLLKRKSVLH